MKMREERIMVCSGVLGQKLSKEEIEMILAFRKQKAEAEQKEKNRRDGLEMIKEGLKLFIEGGGKIHVRDSESGDFEEGYFDFTLTDSKGIYVDLI